VNENSFSYERLCTKTRFEKEVPDNSEMAYSSGIEQGSAYTLCSLNTTQWLLCENGMNPLRSKSNLEPCPQNNTLDPLRALHHFKISDEHTHIYLIEFSLWGNYFN